MRKKERLRVNKRTNQSRFDARVATSLSLHIGIRTIFAIALLSAMGQAQAPITGNGTPGNYAGFTGTTSIGNAPFTFSGSTTTLPANGIFNMTSGSEILPTPSSCDPSTYTQGQSWFNTCVNFLSYAPSSSIISRVAHTGLLNNFNIWGDNYLSNLIAAADAGATVHAVGICIGDSTIAGSGAGGTGTQPSSWCQEIVTNGPTPKLAELLQRRFGRTTATPGFGGHGWLSINTQLTNPGGGGNALPVGTSISSLPPGMTVKGHDGTTTFCPDDTVGEDNTMNESVTWTDNQATSLTFYALGQPNGGSFKCNFDGLGYGSPVSTAYSTYGGTLFSCSQTFAAEGPHSVQVEVFSLGTGNIGVAFCGVRSQDLATNATFEMQKWGSGGAELNQWNDVPTAALSSLNIDPAFVVVESGINERQNGDRTLTQLQGDFHTALGRINTVWPNAAVIYESPHYTNTSSGGTNYTPAQINNAIRDQANLDNVPFLDFFSPTANQGQLKNWADCPYAGAIAGNCVGLHLDDTGNAWMANNRAYPVLADNNASVGPTYSADVTVTFVSGLTTGCYPNGMVTNIANPSSATHYECAYQVSQTTADAGCSTHGTLGVETNWVDNFSGMSMGGTNNEIFLPGNSTMLATQSTAVITSASTLSQATVWSDVRKMNFYDKSGGQISWCPDILTPAAGCGTYPVFQIHASCTPR